MSTKDDLKKMADSNNKNKNELQEKSDKLLSKFYKEMYQLAGKGIYEMKVSLVRDDWSVYRKTFDSLEEEKFSVTYIKTFTPKNDNAIWKISWEK